MFRQTLERFGLFLRDDNRFRKGILVDRFLRNPVCDGAQKFEFDAEFLTDTILQSFQRRLLPLLTQLCQSQLQRTCSDENPLQALQSLVVWDTVGFDQSQDTLRSENALNMPQATMSNAVFIRNASQSICQPLCPGVVERASLPRDEDALAVWKLLLIPGQCLSAWVRLRNPLANIIIESNTRQSPQRWRQRTGKENEPPKAHSVPPGVLLLEKMRHADSRR